MPKPKLSSRDRKHLRGLAHALQPIVRVGRGGVTSGIEREIESALGNHELIKVHLAGERDERAATAADLARGAGAEIVGAIGGVVILFRQHPDPDKRRVKLPAR